GAANVQDIYPLTPLQEGMFFHLLMNTEDDAYLVPSAYRFERREALDAFVQALQQVLDRHDILRSAVHWERLDQPVQLVWRRAPLPLERLARDPRFASASEQLQAREDARLRRIDVRQAPLLRAYELQEDDGGWLLMLLIHHLVMDQQT
ncbi:condensation domain-containing protein, partial [Pelomonas sp. CA6]|uniref:condensation domain-containing protein n=1 Tax=Pelomonas sp. CA6 TaxID=2907999 RepID=UPI001F4C0905